MPNVYKNFTKPSPHSSDQLGGIIATLLFFLVTWAWVLVEYMTVFQKLLNHLRLQVSFSIRDMLISGECQIAILSDNHSQQLVKFLSKSRDDLMSDLAALCGKIWPSLSTKIWWITRAARKSWARAPATIMANRQQYIPKHREIFVPCRLDLSIGKFVESISNCQL